MNQPIRRCEDCSAIYTPPPNERRPYLCPTCRAEAERFRQRLAGVKGSKTDWTGD